MVVLRDSINQTVAFGLEKEMLAGMLNQNGAWAFSDVDGFPPRKVDFTIDEVF